MSFFLTHCMPKLLNVALIASLFISMVQTPFLHESLPTKLCGCGLGERNITGLKPNFLVSMDYGLTDTADLLWRMTLRRQHVHDTQRFECLDMFCFPVCYSRRESSQPIFPHIRIGIGALSMLVAPLFWHKLLVVAVSCRSCRLSSLRTLEY